MRREIGPFFMGPASLVEKYDLTMRIIWYVLMPLITINGFISEYMAYQFTQHDIPYLYPAFPYVYTFAFMSALAINLSVTRQWQKMISFYFWATAVYTAAMPLAGWSFIRHLFSKPVFKPTPKQKRETPVGWQNSVFMVLMGLAAMACIYIWPSPFWPFLAGQGVAFCCFPLYGKLCSDSWIGWIARSMVFIQGGLMIWALVTMWGQTWF
jgi:hypothetical protein